jgi:hypothetical protein
VLDAVQIGAEGQIVRVAEQVLGDVGGAQFVGREAAYGLRARGQQRPQRVDVVRSGEAARHADDCGLRSGRGVRAA